MSLLTHLWLLDKYGPRLTMEELAAVLKRERQTIYNQVSAGTFEIPTYKVRGERFADAGDVAKHMDEARASGVAA
jgi:hypothetical protein